MKDGRRKYSDEVILQVRASTLTISQTAKKFGMPYYTVRTIRLGEIHKRLSTEVATVPNGMVTLRKLTEEQVREIRLGLGLDLLPVTYQRLKAQGKIKTGVELAKKYGVNNSTISAIKYGRCYKDVR